MIVEMLLGFLFYDLPVHIACPFSAGLVVFFLPSCSKSLRILDMSPFSVIHVTDIFLINHQEHGKAGAMATALSGRKQTLGISSLATVSKLRHSYSVWWPTVPDWALDTVLLPRHRPQAGLRSVSQSSYWLTPSLPCLPTSSYSSSTIKLALATPRPMVTVKGLLPPPSWVTVTPTPVCPLSPIYHSPPWSQSCYPLVVRVRLSTQLRGAEIALGGFRILQK